MIKKHLLIWPINHAKQLILTYPSLLVSNWHKLAHETPGVMTWFYNLYLKPWDFINGYRLKPIDVQMKVFRSTFYHWTWFGNANSLSLNLWDPWIKWRKQRSCRFPLAFDYKLHMGLLIFGFVTFDAPSICSILIQWS